MLADEANFFVDIALALFTISLAFSMELSYKELKIFPTLFLYQLIGRRLDMKGLASFTSFWLNVASLLTLGVFWCWLRRWISGTPAGPCLFIAYLVAAAIVGVLPWFIYWLMHWMVPPAQQKTIEEKMEEMCKRIEALEIVQSDRLVLTDNGIRRRRQKSGVNKDDNRHGRP